MKPPARMGVFFIYLATLWAAVLSVDRGNFKTCDQSGFCKRHHGLVAGRSAYKALLDTLQLEPGSLKLQVINTGNQVRFVLGLSAIKDNMVRLRITEAEPLVPRYEPPLGDVLLDEPTISSWSVTEQTADDLTLTFGTTKVHVQANPLRIDVIVDGDLISSFNSRGMLKFEHTRRKDDPKPEAPAENPDAPEEKEDGEEGQDAPEGDANGGVDAAPAAAAAEVAEEPDMWEETFKSHTDSKPNGPQSIGLDVAFPGFEHVYGIPEHADSLALKSTKNSEPYRLYNLDVFEYETDSPMALYGSIPFMMAHNSKHTVGLFWLNGAETWVDVNSSEADKNVMAKLVDFVKGGDDLPQIDTHWFSESGIIDIFLLLGPKPTDVFKQYGKLTGTTPLPPLFAMAYHQCRWNYNDQQDVANVNQGFDDNDIPMDVLWLDIEHTDGKRYFTWDGHKFPDSVGMLNNVSAKGRKMVTIVDPHIKKDDNYQVYKLSKAGGHNVKDKSNNEYEGWCWPGSSTWPDFTTASVREFWAALFNLDQYVGSTLDLYTWNDMNEPSVFNGPEVTMHKDAIHAGGWEHRDLHNLYGTYVHRATYEGHLKRSPNQRPFVLSRAAYAGTQRWGAVWTGDNTGEWPHLKMSLPMVMSLSLAGVTFSGADVGGFFKNPEPELLARWYQAGAFQPFFRGHAHHDTRRREPWLFEKPILDTISAAIRERYSYLPFWYTLFWRGENDGSPPMRPLWVEFPEDKKTFALDHQHMVGGALLVHPVTDSGASDVTTYLPGGADTVWYDLSSKLAHDGGQDVYMPVTLQTIPLYQRGGYIIPRKMRRRRSSSLMFADPITLVVALDKKGFATGELYVDDYDSFDYRKDNYIVNKYTFENGKLKSWPAGPTASTHKTNEWLEKVIIMGVETAPTIVELQGQGKLGFKYDQTTKLLEIRKPGMNIAEDFTITVQ